MCKHTYCQTCSPLSSVSLHLVPIYGPSCFLFIISSVSPSHVSWLCSSCPSLFLSIIVCPAPDRTADLNSKRRPLTSFCFVYLLKFFYFVPVSVPWQGSHRSSSRPSLLQVGVGVIRGPFKSAVHREIAVVRGSFKPVVRSEVHTSNLPFHPPRAPPSVRASRVPPRALTSWVPPRIQSTQENVLGGYPL